MKHEPCPKCGSKDNLGRYDDGSAWCFGCGYYEYATNDAKFRNLDRREESCVVQEKASPITLPPDSDTYIPALGSSWLRKYDLTIYEIIHNKILWSEKYKALIFPYFDVYGNLNAWQARNFETVGHGNTLGKSKWFSQGNLKNLYHILPFGGNSSTIVLVEDIVSAIKVARVTPCMPIFGSTIGLDRFKTLYNRFSEVKIWLDPDKRKQSLLEAKKAQQLGLTVKVVMSDRDPKEYDEFAIMEILNG